MKKLDLNFETNIGGQPYNVGKELAASLERINVRDEAGIRKIQVYIDYLHMGNPFSLDEADLHQFKEVVIACDLWHGLKMPVLRLYDKMKE